MRGNSCWSKSNLKKYSIVSVPDTLSDPNNTEMLLVKLRTLRLEIVHSWTPD